jgi:dTMP kinase
VLITVEGLDGAGKSTLVRGLGRELGATVLREPGGVEAAERIRDLVKGSAHDARAEALLFAAARAQLVAEKLAPLLDAGTTVVLDRFVDSSLAYQGGGRGLGVDEVRAINAFACAGVVPDRTLLLRLDPEAGLARVGGGRDHFEDLEFLRRVAATYDELAAAEPERWVVLDASASKADVLAAALAAVRYPFA